MTFQTLYKKELADLHTPVELYLKLRDKFPHSFLLESSQYNSKENNYTYICLDPIASFISTKEETIVTKPNSEKTFLANSAIDITQELTKFINSFKVEKDQNIAFINNGLFGYSNYESLELFQDIELQKSTYNLPVIQYHFFRYLLVFNHFNNDLYIIEHVEQNKQPTLDNIIELLKCASPSAYPFKNISKEQTNQSDQEFMESLKEVHNHCKKGDVFQLVLSRGYEQKFQGDDFNVYRTLRSINPSPYLFYFDYGNFKIFGSSPEAQLVVKNNKAYIHPIAGTFKRTHDTNKDKELAIALQNDPKESAEHIMLVDLARNDLSIESNKVEVEEFKKVEYYSHVIHLVSKVSGVLENQSKSINVFKNTFPAGTLSGAPKRKAIELINKYETKSRGFYGGSVGILGLDGNINQAIFIRSVLSLNNTLHYQAGCGVVILSNLQSELQEINNKLTAVRTAINLAQNI
ncbi:anthranilate synthase component I family protein [Myroides sp. LJL115]